MAGRSLPAALLGFVLLAGCAGSPDTAAQEGHAGPEGAGPRLSTPSPSLSAAFPIQGSGTFGWNASFGHGGGTPLALFADHSVELQVPAGASAIAFTIEWTCAVDLSCSLNVGVKRDGQPDSATLTGDGRVTVEIQAPDAGEWFVTAMSDGATAGVKGTAAWTISGPRQA